MRTVERAAWLLAEARAQEIAGTAVVKGSTNERSDAARGPMSAAAVPAPFVNIGSATSLAKPCGGEYPPCYVAQRESGNTYDAFNPNGCGGNACFGRWQFSGAWAGKLGLPLDLRSATPAQQDDAARLLWSGGRGCSNWNAC